MRRRRRVGVSWTSTASRREQRRFRRMFGTPADQAWAVDRGSTPTECVAVSRRSWLGRGDADRPYETVLPDGRSRASRCRRAIADGLVESLDVATASGARSSREADRQKDDFIALLAHELRNPLAPIRNGLQVLRLSDDRAVAGAVAGDDGPAARRTWCG